MPDPSLRPSERPSWYELTATATPGHAPLQGPLETEVCVVGGGLAGLATTLSLAERGVAVALLEARRLGAGASGRNGGLVSGGFARSTQALERQLRRPHAQALHAASMEGLRLIRQRLGREQAPVPVVEGILVAALFDGPEELGRAITPLNRHYGMRLEVRDRAWMREAYRTRRYSAGVLDPDGFHLDPLALARCYAEAALGRGARIHEASPATALERQATGGWVVRTEAGRVTARQVVLATSVHAPPLSASLSRALVPVATFVIVTEPLGARLEGTIAPSYGVYDDRFATGYYRPLPDGRLLWGGRIALSDRLPDLEAVLRRDLAFIYPQLGGVGIAAAWAGWMAFPRHKMPLIGRLADGLWTATGFGGHGLNTTTMAGELIAEAIAEGGRRHELLRPFAPVPVFGALGRVAAQLLYRGHQIRDSWRLQRRRREGGSG
jgi:gamma-glutamylputrescine oxidase